MSTVLITGANRGIGLELCRQYLADGWEVLACCRHPEEAAALNKLGGEFSERLKIYELDVADPLQIISLGQELADTAIDVLINNAGIYPSSDRSGFGNTDYGEWMSAFSINTMAPLKMAETFIEQVRRGQQKKIVTISSQMGSIDDNSSGGSYQYRSSKAAVNMVMKSLAVDLKNQQIVSVAMNPGWVLTDMGGPNAMISVSESVTGLRQVIQRLELADSGKFIDYSGQLIPW